jgi:hypothetical protein
MIQIRSEQITIFKKNAEQRDIDEFCNKLLNQYPKLHCHDNLRLQVQAAVFNAQQNALSSKSDIYTFVTFKVVYNIAVEKTSTFKTVIEDPSVKANMRMLAFVQRTKPSFWQKHFTTSSSEDIHQFKAKEE